VLCLSPPFSGVSSLFDVVVVVSEVPSTFPGLRWRHTPPVVTSVSPPAVAPGTASLASIAGVGFGIVAGRVMMGTAQAAVLSWNDTTVSCLVPPGVVRSVPVVVHRVDGANSSGSVGGVLAYLRPALASSVEIRTGTRGGVPLVLSVVSAAAPLPMTVWLLPPGANSSVAPWGVGGLPCPLVNSSGPGVEDATVSPNATGAFQLQCTVPASVGGPWPVVVVNHEETAPGQPSLLRWQGSMPNASAAFVMYDPPVVLSVEAVSVSTWRAAVLGLLVSSSGGGNGTASPGVSVPRPAAGGFLLLVHGRNFGAGPPVVAVAGRPCAALAEDGASSHEHTVCTAPPLARGVPCVVQVTQAGQASPAVPFAFDPPAVLAVAPDAVIAVGRCVWAGALKQRCCSCVPGSEGLPRLFGCGFLPSVPPWSPLPLPPLLGPPTCLCSQRSMEASFVTLTGVNFGVPSAALGPSAHVVRVAGAVCGNVEWRSDTTLVCSLVGSFPPSALAVSVVVEGVAATVAPSALLHASCPRDFYGQDGQECLPCPAGALCRGGGADPEALFGRFPITRTEFVACQPAKACRGGVNFTAALDSSVACRWGPALLMPVGILCGCFC
jgi:hypothetical protein